MKNTLQFLEKLQVNNNRERFHENNDEYQDIRKNIIALADRIIKKISIFYPKVGDLEPKKCIFRINRDTRFSKNKTPYKTNFGIEFSPGGKRSGMPGFYLHIEPGNKSFLGCGLYMLQGDIARAVRAGVDKDGKTLQKILDKIFLSDKNCNMYDDALKSAPRGYKRDHPYIELLKLKHWIIDKPLSDKDLLKSNFEKKIIEFFETVDPFVGWLDGAVNSYFNKGD